MPKTPAKTTKTAAKRSTKTKAAARKKAAPSKEVKVSRRDSKDRRSEEDRRQDEQPVADERRQLQRREKVNRRRQIDPTTCERDYSLEEIEFMSALDDYKRKNGRMFPTCSEILEVIKQLGYEKSGPQAIAPAAEIETEGELAVVAAIVAAESLPSDEYVTDDELVDGDMVDDLPTAD